MEKKLKRCLIAEFIGSMFLVIAAIGSTILPFGLSGSTIVLTVFINAIAVAFVLFALIETFGPISGAHFNPAVTIAMLVAKEIDRAKAGMYIAVQLAGGMIGLLVTDLMFYGTASTFYTNTSQLLSISSNVKGLSLVFSEFICAFILVAVIFGCVRNHSKYTSLAVGMLVGGMLITSSSTMFANPMVTVSRMFTYAICGIAPASGVLYIIAEIFGAASAAVLLMYLYPKISEEKTTAPSTDHNDRPLITEHN